MGKRLFLSLCIGLTLTIMATFAVGTTPGLLARLRPQGQLPNC